MCKQPKQCYLCLTFHTSASLVFCGVTLWPKEAVQSPYCNSSKKKTWIVFKEWSCRPECLAAPVKWSANIRPDMTDCCSTVIKSIWECGAAFFSLCRELVFTVWCQRSTENVFCISSGWCCRAMCLESGIWTCYLSFLPKKGISLLICKCCDKGRFSILFSIFLFVVAVWQTFHKVRTLIAFKKNLSRWALWFASKHGHQKDLQEWLFMRKDLWA